MPYLIAYSFSNILFLRVLKKAGEFFLKRTFITLSTHISQKGRPQVERPNKPYDPPPSPISNLSTNSAKTIPKRNLGTPSKVEGTRKYGISPEYPGKNGRGIFRYIFVLHPVGKRHCADL
ncbi:hypothetical protein CDAR_477441 [Caerostris darwini]|uniref:Uncharacterized protein n=1 Tax=Caerostris darwini TaxID=1538125 RepID=A0AAV4QND1_9ARAC|nr:hypothetical protein CDAR_477441 [Caerostris darwini]